MPFLMMFGVFAFNGANYCAMGSSIGTHIFKVGETELELIDFEPGSYQNRYVEHRDYKAISELSLRRM